MEFVIVTFPNRRQVFMDDQPSGQTGERLTVQAGHHDFDLGSPADYSPSAQTVNVAGTTASDPLMVAFDEIPLAVAAAAGDAVAAGPPSRRAAPRRAAGGGSRKAKKATARKAKPRRTSRKRAATKKKATSSKPRSKKRAGKHR